MNDFFSEEILSEIEDETLKELQGYEYLLMNYGIYNTLSMSKTKTVYSFVFNREYLDVPTPRTSTRKPLKTYDSRPRYPL